MHKLLMKFLWFAKGIYRQIFGIFQPREFITVKLNGRAIEFAKLSGDTGDQIFRGDEIEIYEWIETLPKGSVFYDLGASIGNFSLYAANSGLKVFAFEPDPKSFAVLSKNILNAESKSGVKIVGIEAAINSGISSSSILLTNTLKNQPGDHHHVLKLDYSYGEPGIFMNLSGQVEVASISIDQFIFEKGNPPPDFMKIDIDGSELEFVKGAKKYLGSKLCKGFILELFEDEVIYNQIIANLLEYGYVIERMYPVSHKKVPVKGLFNVLFSPTS